MKTLLLTLSLGLLAALQAQTLPVQDEETQDASGLWYMKATAADKEIPLKRLDSVSVTPMTIKTLEGGHLEVNFTVLLLQTCPGSLSPSFLVSTDSGRQCCPCAHPASHLCVEGIGESSIAWSHMGVP